MRKLLKQCPVCSGEMMIRELECVECQTRIVSEFDIQSGNLEIDQDILDFIKVFIFAEGSIKQSEKILNCSYPKIKNLLKKAKAALKVEKEPEEDGENVLNQLERGDISVEDAIRYYKEKNNQLKEEK